MVVSMVNVGIVRMAVREPVVAVWVSMAVDRGHVLFVLMIMMLVMSVSVIVHDLFVRMNVFVDAGRHDGDAHTCHRERDPP